MELLSKLFGSVLRVKILRLFLFQTGDGFSLNEIVKRTQSKTEPVRKEMAILHKIGFVSEIAFTETTETTVTPKKGDKNQKIKTKVSEKRVKGYSINRKFQLIGGLNEMLIESHLMTREEVQKYFAPHTHIKLLVLSGIFVKETNSQADILIVGEKLDQKSLQATIKIIESEVGKEIRYSLFTPEEFAYRINMYDKYILDILSKPHERIVEKMEIPKP